MATDIYNLGHQTFKINTDFEISHIYNRSAPMVLYGFNENVRRIFGQRINTDMVEEAKHYAKIMGVWFPEELFLKVIKEFGGLFPVVIEGLPDGKWVPQGTPFAQVYNTAKGYGELVTWWEAQLIKSWFPSACATRALQIRQYLDRNSYPPNKFHSFGYRSHRSEEDAYWCGTAWNLFLEGTDDFHTLIFDPEVKTGSIPALAHKVVQQFDNELDCYLRAIEQTRDHGGHIMSMVIDTYDPWYFINYLSSHVMSFARANGITIVFRPDSGAVLNQTISLLRMYPDCFVIIGEGMTFQKGVEYDNIIRSENLDPKRVFYGIGSAFHHDLNRDSLGWAMKTAYSNGKDRMKFSADRGKVSMPGNIFLRYTTLQVMEVMATDFGNYESSSLYNIIYMNDGKPEYWEQSMSDIRRVIKENPNFDQGSIVINDDINHKINTFRERYIKNV